MRNPRRTAATASALMVGLTLITGMTVIAGSVQKGIDDLRKQAEATREGARGMDVPPQNVALFKKYEAEIKKYAMAGLEWIGL